MPSVWKNWYKEQSVPDSCLTTSWDDGHPLDLKLAEMLARHAIAATFYVPVANAEARPVLETSHLRQIADSGFEIGSHTHDHVRLDRLTPRQIHDQIARGKMGLEQKLGSPVTGFCYPGGKGISRARPAAAALGITHARTVEMFRLDRGTDPLARPTSLHFHPHGLDALLRNWGRQGLGPDRLRLCLGCAIRPSLEARLDWLIQQAVLRQGLLHVWGHSWEIEAFGLWPTLDRFLARAAQAFAPARRLTNAAAFQETPSSCAS